MIEPIVTYLAYNVYFYSIRRLCSQIPRMQASSRRDPGLNPDAIANQIV